MLPGQDGVGQGIFIGILDIHAHGNATGKTAGRHAGSFELIRQVRGRSLARHSGTGGNQYLFNSAGLYPEQEFPHLEFVRTDAIHGRKHAMEDMVEAVKDPGFFNEELITWLFHHAQKTLITAGISADAAGICFRKGEAEAAKVDGAMQVQEILGQVFGFVLRSAQDVERKPCCCFPAYAGQAGKIVNQPVQGRGNDLHGWLTSGQEC